MTRLAIMHVCGGGEGNIYFRDKNSSYNSSKTGPDCHVDDLAGMGYRIINTNSVGSNGVYVNLILEST